MNRNFLMTSFLYCLIVVDIYHALVSWINIDLKIIIYIFRLIFIDVSHVNLDNVWMIFVRIINLICNCLTWNYHRNLKLNCTSSILIFVFASIQYSINSILYCILCLRDVLLKWINSHLSTSKRESYVYTTTRDYSFVRYRLFICHLSIIDRLNARFIASW